MAEGGLGDGGSILGGGKWLVEKGGDENLPSVWPVPSCEHLYLWLST